MSSLPPFNDARDVVPDFRSSQNVSGSDLSSIDPYRQGVEIRTSNQYHMGNVKIHSGYPNHTFPQTEFGQSSVRLTQDDWYLDVDTFDPLTFIGLKSNTTSTSSALHTYEGTFPRISSNIGAQPDEAMDGALEPFTIRARASFFSVEAPFESHDIRGSLVDGNEEKNGASDMIVTIYELDQLPNRSAFLDSADVIGRLPVQGDFEVSLNKIVPWKDRLIPSGSITSTNMDDSFMSALNSMGSDQSNMIPARNKSTTCGFVYDTGEGTDSLAFGGFTYFSASVSLPPIA